MGSFSGLARLAAPAASSIIRRPFSRPSVTATMRGLTPCRIDSQSLLVRSSSPLARCRRRLHAGSPSLHPLSGPVPPRHGRSAAGRGHRARSVSAKRHRPGRSSAAGRSAIRAGVAEVERMTMNAAPPPGDSRRPSSPAQPVQTAASADLRRRYPAILPPARRHRRLAAPPPVVTTPYPPAIANRHRVIQQQRSPY